MRLQLKKIKTAGGDETLRFTAELYLDRQKIATVSNGGSGGGHEYNFIDRKSRQEFEAFIERIQSQPLDPKDPLQRSLSEYVKDMQSVVPQFHQGRIDMDIVVDCQIELQQFVKLCRNKTLFRLIEDSRTVYRTIDAVFTEEIKTYLQAKYGDKIVIINELI